MFRGTTQWAQIHGRRECTDADVAAILVDILDQCGGATLHRITSSNTRGEEYLEAAGRNAMLGPEDMAVDENDGDVDDVHAGDVFRLVTMNVAGVCDDLTPAKTRMDEILTKLLADEKPDVLCFQEVTDEMYRERTARSLIFDTEPLCGPEPWPMVPPSNLPFKPSLQTLPSNLPFKPSVRTSLSNLPFKPLPRRPPEKQGGSRLLFSTKTFPSNLPFKPSVRTSPSNLPIKPAFQTTPSNLPFESSFKSSLQTFLANLPFDCGGDRN